MAVVMPLVFVLQCEWHCHTTVNGHAFQYWHLMSKVEHVPANLSASSVASWLLAVIQMTKGFAATLRHIRQSFSRLSHVWEKPVVSHSNECDQLEPIFFVSCNELTIRQTRHITAYYTIDTRHNNVFIISTTFNYIEFAATGVLPRR